MYKKFSKVIIVLFLFFAIINIGSVSKAAKVDVSKYEVIYPVEKTSSTANNNVLVNGKAPTGTNIKIDIFITTDLTKKNFDLSKLPENKDYINTQNIQLTAGNMSYFQHEISLVNGINKMILDFGVKEILPKEYIIYVYDTSNGNTSRKMIEIVPILK